LYIPATHDETPWKIRSIAYQGLLVVPSHTQRHPVVASGCRDSACGIGMGDSQGDFDNHLKIEQQVFKIATAPNAKSVVALFVPKASSGETKPGCCEESSPH
jgi:hypothetical protein